MSQIKIAGGKFALQGTNGKSPAWVPGWNRYVDLINVSPIEAAELVKMKYPHVVKAESEESEESTPESFKKLKLDELKALAAEKGIEEALYKDLTKKDDVISLLTD